MRDIIIVIKKTHMNKTLVFISGMTFIIILAVLSLWFFISPVSSFDDGSTPKESENVTLAQADNAPTTASSQKSTQTVHTKTIVEKTIERIPQCESDGEVLQWDGAGDKWECRDIDRAVLQGVNEDTVDVSSDGAFGCKEDQAFLYWDAGEEEWNCRVLSQTVSADAGIEDLSGVNVVTPTAGHVLQYSGTEWISALPTDNDTDNQQLSLSGTTLALTGGLGSDSSVDLSSIGGTALGSPATTNQYYGSDRYGTTGYHALPFDNLDTGGNPRTLFNNQVRFDSRNHTINNPALVFREEDHTEVASNKGSLMEWQQYFDAGTYPYGIATNNYGSDFTIPTSGHKRVAWLMTHYDSTLGTGEDVHQHFNIETVQADFSNIVTRLQISYGEDVALVGFPNSRVRVYDDKPLQFGSDADGSIVYDTTDDALNVVGSTSAGGKVSVTSTSNATKGKIQFGDLAVIEENNDRIGLGTLSPGGRVEVASDQDEPVLKISGSHAGATNAPLLQMEADNAADKLFQGGLVTDAVKRINITAGGTLEFGPGNAARDIILYRNAADSLRTDGSIIVDDNVGIGEINPDAKLQVDAGTSSRTALFQSTTPLSTIAFQDSLTTGGFSTRIGTDGDDFIVRTNDTEAMRVEVDGDVGIGTPTPSEKLHVAGNIFATGTISPSDKDFKRDIQPVEDALEKLAELEGVSYEFKTEEFEDQGFAEGTQYGVIAQDIEKVFPELVTTYEVGEKDASYKAVNYTGLIGPMIQGINELQKALEEGGIKTKEIAGEVIDFAGGIIKESVTFAKDVIFQERVTFADQDMGGFAEIVAGDTEVYIKYEDAYEMRPVLTVTPRAEGPFQITDESEEGFTLKIPGALQEDVLFSWIALQIEDPKTHTSKK